MINTLLITGCTYGLGRALALKFAKDNYDVYAVGRSKDLLGELAKMHASIQPIVADITTIEGRETINEYVKQKNSISVIHNAAIAEPCQFSLMSESLLREHIETNYIAPILITQNLLPLLTKGQRILHVTSGAANMAISGLMPYCTTKAAMQLATQCLNAEMKSRGVYCANLRPGVIDTPMESKLRDADVRVLPSRDFYINLAKENKLISPELVAEFVSWVMLKTDDASFNETSWNIYDESHHQYWLPLHEKMPTIS